MTHHPKFACSVSVFMTGIWMVSGVVPFITFMDMQKHGHANFRMPL